MMKTDLSKLLKKIADGELLIFEPVICTMYTNYCHPRKNKMITRLDRGMEWSVIVGLNINIVMKENPVKVLLSIILDV